MQPGTEAKSVKFIEPSVSGNGGKMSPSSASSKQTIHSQMTPALDVVPESTLSQENRVTTGWDSAFLGANAASSAAATKAVADEIAKHSAGNCRGGISARQPCMTKGTDEDKGNHILGLCHGLQVNVYQVSKTAGANPAAASSAAAAVCTDPMKQQYSLAAEPGVSECLSADGVGTPLCFSDKPEESLAATRSEAFADGRNCVPTFESGMGIPPSLESLQGSTSLKSETLSGEQSPIFRLTALDCEPFYCMYPNNHGLCVCTDLGENEIRVEIKWLRTSLWDVFQQA